MWSDNNCLYYVLDSHITYNIYIILFHTWKHNTTHIWCYSDHVKSLKWQICWWNNKIIKKDYYSFRSHSFVSIFFLLFFGIHSLFLPSYPSHRIRYFPSRPPASTASSALALAFTTASASASASSSSQSLSNFSCIIRFSFHSFPFLSFLLFPLKLHLECRQMMYLWDKYLTTLCVRSPACIFRGYFLRILNTMAASWRGLSNIVLCSAVLLCFAICNIINGYKKPKRMK